MQNSRLRIALGALVVSLTFVLAGCGNIAEKAVEKAIEKGTGTEIDTDKDGSITVKGKDGESDFQLGEGTSMPKDFPKNLPLPDSGTLVAAIASQGTWGLTFQNVSTSDYESLVSKFESAGAHSTYSGQAEGNRQNMYELGDYNLTLFWAADGNESSLVYSVAQKQG